MTERAPRTTDPGSAPLEGAPLEGASPVDASAEGAASEAAPDRGLGRRIAIAVVLGLLVYAAFALWTDLDGLGEALARIPWWAPVAACGLSLANYAVRFPRWQRYLTIVGSDVRGATSARIYLAGLALTVSPGKVGEAMKSWLLREVDGTPIAKSAPIVLAERVTDLAGFLVLIAISSALMSAGSENTQGHGWITAATVVLAASVLTLVSSRKVASIAVGVAKRLPVVGPRADKIAETLDSARLLLAPKELPIATLLAALGWGLECVGCWVLAQSVLPPGTADVPALGLASVTYAFAVSAVAGAVVVISPGGLGVTEGVLSGLLSDGYASAGFVKETAQASALSITLVTRLCTLWFAMAVGLIALQAHRRRFRRG